MAEYTTWEDLLDAEPASGEAAEHLDQSARREGIELLEAHQVDVVDTEPLALLVEVVIKLTRAHHHAADLVVGLQFDLLPGLVLRVVPEHAVEARIGTKLVEVGNDELIRVHPHMSFSAIAQDDMKRILAFHIISQIGYMLFGLGLFTTAGVAGAVFYVVHHIIVKTALFLVASLVTLRAGSSRLSQVGGLVREAPVVAALFAVPALSLAGMPPFSGFLAKFALVDAGVADHAWAPVAVSLAVGLLTLFSMTKIWSGAFWGERDEEPDRTPIQVGRLGAPISMIGATAVLAAASIAVSVWAGPLYALAERASTDLLDPRGYIEIVLDRGAEAAP